MQMMSFFFFKQKTAYEMRISDWSSDVCSSDLLDPRTVVGELDVGEHEARLMLLRLVDRLAVRRRDGDDVVAQVADDHFDVHRDDRFVLDDQDARARLAIDLEIGRAHV